MLIVPFAMALAAPPRRLLGFGPGFKSRVLHRRVKIKGCNPTLALRIDLVEDGAIEQLARHWRGIRDGMDGFFHHKWQCTSVRGWVKMSRVTLVRE